MKLTAKYKLEPDAEQERHLSNLCHYATKLYNTDNYQRRKVWAETGKIPNGYAQKKALRETVWFKLLPSQTAQEVSFVCSKIINHGLFCGKRIKKRIRHVSERKQCCHR